MTAGKRPEAESPADAAVDAALSSPGTQLAELRARIAGAEIWYVRDMDGHMTWVLRLHADTSQHLIDELRAAAKDAETGL